MLFPNTAPAAVFALIELVEVFAQTVAPAPQAHYRPVSSSSEHARIVYKGSEPRPAGESAEWDVIYDVLGLDKAA